MAIIKTNKRQVLMRMQQGKKLYILLVRMYINIATVETSKQVPKKIKHRIAIGFSKQ
jgi:hypothetical protein